MQSLAVGFFSLKKSILVSSWILSNLKCNFNICHSFIIDSAVGSTRTLARCWPLSDVRALELQLGLRGGSKTGTDASTPRASGGLAGNT